MQPERKRAAPWLASLQPEETNRSKMGRTNKLYSSLVATAANFKQLKDGDFKDPHSQRLMQTLGMTPTMEAGSKKPKRAGQLASIDIKKNFDLSKAQ